MKSDYRLYAMARCKGNSRLLDLKTMTKPWRKETIRFRLANSTQRFLSELRRDLPMAEVITKERQGKLILLLKLDDWEDFKSLYRIIKKNRIPSRDCKFSASLLTEGYMGGMSVPKFALKLLCRLGCELNFSFIKI